MNQNVWDSYKHEKNPEKIVSIHWQFFKRFSSSFNLVEILKSSYYFWSAPSYNGYVMCIFVIW